MGAPFGLPVDSAQPSGGALTDAADALCGRLAARVGGAWAPAGPGARSMSERGLVLTLSVSMGEHAAGKVRIEVRPVVSFGWYVPVLLLPLIPLRYGYPWWRRRGWQLGRGLRSGGWGAR